MCLTHFSVPAWCRLTLFVAETRFREKTKVRRRLNLGIGLLAFLCSILGLLILNRPVPFPQGGLLHWNKKKALDGYNVLKEECRVLDMKGELVYKFPGSMCVFYNNGDVASYQNGMLMMYRLRPSMKILWQQKVWAHHEIRKDDKGNIWLNGWRTHKFKGRLIRFESIHQFSRQGKLLYAWDSSTRMKALARLIGLEKELSRPAHELFQLQYTDYAHLRYGRSTYYARYMYNIGQLLEPNIGTPLNTKFAFLHSNSVSVIPPNPYTAKYPFYRAGNIVTHLNPHNVLVIIDPRTDKVVWSMKSGKRRGLGQHSLRITKQQTFLYFSNNDAIDDQGTLRNHSKIIELNPRTRKIVWEYTGTPKSSFWSNRMGSVQRLSNGNTLICDSLNGRAFEVTPDKEIVWHWFHRFVPEAGRRMEVFNLERQPKAVIQRAIPLGP